jgi:hypothetical protein
MWIYKGNEFTSDMIDKYVGFVYCLTEIESGKKYIGKKKFWSKITKPPLKGKKRKRKELKESNWMSYCGSNPETMALAEEHGHGVFFREILHLCDSLGELSYLELKEQVDRCVLLRDEYYNGIIQCRIHKSHVKKLKI